MQVYSSKSVVVNSFIMYHCMNLSQIFNFNIMLNIVSNFQVDREKKWGEVVFALKLEGNSVKLCAQAEKFYAHLLYQFEQLYFYRRPAKQAGSNSTKG